MKVEGGSVISSGSEKSLGMEGIGNWGLGIGEWGMGNGEPGGGSESRIGHKSDRTRGIYRFFRRLVFCFDFCILANIGGT